MTRPLEDYVEVAERIEKFYEKYPEGSLRCKEIRSVEIGEQHFLVYVAQAFRTAKDEAPAEGSAWEPVPGKTNFTRDSELMNAETSAWGRAIAALGFEVKRGIASRQEVLNRRGNDDGKQESVEASPAQKRKLTELFNKAQLAREAQKAIVLFRCRSEKATKDGASQLISDLIEGATAESLLAEISDGRRAGNPLAARAAALIPTDVPNAEPPPEPEPPNGDNIPF